MIRTKNNKVKSVISMLLALCMVASFVPMSVFAAQSNEYVDPVDRWLETNSRTNELDMNSTITYETQYCPVCKKSTTMMTYRVPEYTKSGETALNHNVFYSDGMNYDGTQRGNADGGTPGVNAYYTGYHLTKSVCQNCGTINAVNGEGSYSFNNNVYSINSCDRDFFIKYDNTTYEPYSAKEHTTILKKGEYCQFCKGTLARGIEQKESHNFTDTIDGQIGNNRFYVGKLCDDCGYEATEYITAKSVVSSYYGSEDNKAHTVTVSDLSDGDVHTSIRYGTSAGKCNLTSAPNYTQAGYYPVYYEIDYSYDGESMTENGVSYVWLLAKSSDNDESASSGSAHAHEYYYYDTVEPTCTELGYDRFQCKVCGHVWKTNYKAAIGHSYNDIVIKEASCKQGGLVLHLCKKCGDFYEETTSLGEHSYEKNIVAPTCKSAGYTEYKCKDCGYSYITDMKPVISHSYKKLTKEPTCTDKGYTSYICSMCNESYVSDYTDALGHDWDEGHTVTNSTCTGDGVTEYACKRCNEKMIKATSATGHTPGKAATCTEPQVCEKCGTVLQLPLGHSYTKDVTNPTCTAMGFTTYTCERCNDSYAADFTEKISHDYEKTVTAPTCTELGYTTYTCKSCNDTYVSDYKDKLSHNCTAEVTEPTCTAMGYTTFTCKDCGETYKADYKDAAGHKSSEWVIDTEATIEHSGAKHTECLVCGKVLQTADISQLIDKDNTDEDGKSEVGAYSIILTDKDGKPVFNSEISIDVNDKISIKLPENRILDYADQTTITVFKTDTQKAVSGLNIFVADKNGNNATGTTNSDGQLKVPNDKSSTGDDNGTIGGGTGEGDESKKFTYVVTVTDKTNAVIPSCDIYIGESNNIVVKLPDGLILTQESPAIITVTDNNGQPQKDISVIVIGDKDYMEKGTTDVYGKLTVPAVNSGYTDKDGKVNVQGYNVIVNDENKFISNALVTLNEDGTISVKLPASSLIDYSNRITVTVLDKDGKAVNDISVTVSDVKEKTGTGLTDENGKMTVPSLCEDYTDKDGKATVNGMNVLVTDEAKPIENAFVTIIDGKISVKLPETSVIDIANRITVTVTDKEDKPVKDMSVTVSDKTERSETDLTDENGKMTVPPTNIDYTDINGKANVDGFIVIVNNEKGFVEKAFVTHTVTKSEPDAEGKTTEMQNISVKLPDNTLIDYANRTTVTVLNKADNTAVSGMAVNISEFKADGKTAAGVTDKDGKVTVPPINEDITDDDGKGDVTDKIPEKDTDGDGKPDTEETTKEYVVIVNDTKGIVTGSFIKVEDGKIFVTLPDTNTLTTANQTTVTVMDKDSKAMQGISVTVTDKDKVTVTQSTNTNGQITVPVKSSGGSSSGSHSSGGGGGSSSSYSTTNIKITDKDGKNVTGFSKSIDSKGNITVTLPTGKIIDENNYYTITVTDNKGNAKADTNVTLKDRKDGMAAGTTDKNGMLTLPASEHKAYIVGYPDGTFKPDGDMSRAEAAAIFARLISDKKDEKISGTKTDFTDVSKSEWYINYISYLEKYNIIKGYNDGTFKPDAPVTRAEFVAMSVRYYALFNEVKTSGYTVKYTDVNSSYWAYNDVAYAKNVGWLNGYADGTFKGDNNITRAEVVTVVNRALERTADKEYVKGSFTKLNRFTDVTDSSMWFFFDVNEAANDHKAVIGTGSETWTK